MVQSPFPKFSAPTLEEQSKSHPLRDKHRLIDVRSPSEYQKGHIPYALSLPLFNDEEHKIIGTCYKQVGEKEAIALGIEKVAAKVDLILSEGKEGIIYCWRGGMRSQALFHFFYAAGIGVTPLAGGYKAYRRWVKEVLHFPYIFKVLGGKTGVGKTETLQNLNEPFIDLEALASHKGSSFGALENPQPTQEHFENLLAEALFKLQRTPIWIEDESRMIGSLKIPDPIWERMHTRERWILEAPLEERIHRLIREYGKKPKKT